MFCFVSMFAGCLDLFYHVCFELIDGVLEEEEERKAETTRSVFKKTTTNLKGV